MAAPKKKYFKFMTPVGVAQYPKLDKAYKWDDSAERSLPDPDGERSTKLAVPNKDAQALIKVIKEAIKDAGIKPKHIPYKDEEKDGDKTGNVLFNLKAYGKDRDGNDNKLKFFDTDGNPVKSNIIVTGGSKLRLLGYISVSKMGCRMNIREVQIIELAERESEGFGAYEGGSFKADKFGGKDRDEDEDVDPNEDDEDENKNKNETSDSEAEETTDPDDEEEF